MVLKPTQLDLAIPYSEECVWKYYNYRELLRRPRRKQYWNRENEYIDKVMKMLKEIKIV
ncbi:MAG: hypothetical protein QXG46_02920 [Ignisphaera sp.]